MSHKRREVYTPISSLRSTQIADPSCLATTDGVDMYNVTDGSVFKLWQRLSVPRHRLAAAYANGVVVFAGGASADLFAYGT